jgi:hypothetical protein
MTLHDSEEDADLERQVLLFPRPFRLINTLIHRIILLVDTRTRSCGSFTKSDS